MRLYKTVVMDPPWPAAGYCNGTKKGRLKPGNERPAYKTMSIQEIAAIPPPLDDDAWLFLWTINRFVHHAFHLIDAWNLRYRCFMVWHKPNGPKPVGLPTYNGELVLVASRGKPRFLETFQFRTVNKWETISVKRPGAWGRQVVASAKPPGFYELLQRVTPGPRLDMYNRRMIPGFDGWGDESPHGCY